jgi:long-chain acyl-CoA synthetase
MMNYVALSSGVAIYFVDDPATVVAVAKKVQPTYFIGVPRFFEKVYQGIHQKLAAKPRYVRRLVDLALARSPRIAGAKGSVRRRVEWRILDALVLRRLRGVLGGRLRFMITGSAPTAPWILEYFDHLGILLLEAYGLSECTIPIAANRPDAYRFGSVGRVFAMNDVQIAEDNEILVRGPGMFDGYVGNGDVASGNFTPEGFYRTGDLGRFDAESFLYVTGRKSEVFKTSTGRWVAPARVEAAYKKIPYIEQIVVVGKGQRYPVALLTINGPLLAGVLKRRKVTHSEVAGPDNFAGQPAVHSQIAADFEALGTELNAYERIRRFRVLPGLLTLEGGELTPSLKLRREVIAAKYSEVIDGLYQETA